MSTMLRGHPSAINPAPIRLEPKKGTHHPPLSQPEPSRLDGEHDQRQYLMYERRETTPSESTSRAATASAEDNLSPTAASRHQGQPSVPNFTSRRVNTPPISPSRGHSRQVSQGMPPTRDGRSGTSPTRLSGWFSGTSTPVSSVDGDSMPMSHTIRASVETTPKSTAQSRLSFLASSVSAFTSRMTSPTQAPVRYDDDLCNLDIETALFPAVSPLDTDTFSPAAYKNLQMNAMGLLHRMQDAYRQRTATLREMEAEREVHQEEMEEADLRARNFKNQLEKMAAKAAENEKAMQQLVAELQAEKQARHEERAARDQMFRTAAAAAAAATTTEYDGSVVCNEDLCVDEDERKRWRKSNSTLKSELSTDTDGDVDSAESESIFSRSRSPTAMTCITENESLGPGLGPSPTLHPRSAAGPPKPRSTQQQPQQQLTTFQRLVKGISTVGKDQDASDSSGGCRNCRGQNASVAWDTVSLLRDENIALKRRVAQLDSVVEGALDIVNGIKI